MTIEELGYRGSAATQFLIRFLAWMESQKKAASSGPTVGAGLVFILSMVSDVCSGLFSSACLCDSSAVLRTQAQAEPICPPAQFQLSHGKALSIDLTS